MLAIFGAVIVITRRVGARAVSRADEVRAEAERLGEEWLLPLEGATFRGARHAYSRARGHGVLGLTVRRLVFVPIAGDPVSVPVVRATGARLEDSGRDAAATHRHRLVLALDDDDQLTFLVDDSAAWAAALAAAGVEVTAR